MKKFFSTGQFTKKLPDYHGQKFLIGVENYSLVTSGLAFPSELEQSLLVIHVFRRGITIITKGFFSNSNIETAINLSLNYKTCRHQLLVAHMFLLPIDEFTLTRRFHFPLSPF